jgi:hypothetical protein
MTGQAKTAKPGNPEPATRQNAEPAKPRKPERARPRNPEAGSWDRRNGEPENRRRHWHPAVPGVRAAVPLARRLVGGGRC